MKIKTCELCGFSFDGRYNHQCDNNVLEDRFNKEHTEDRREELQAGEMYINFN